MANFRATIQGQRGQASRLGSKSSGIEAQVRGWNAGVSVFGAVENGVDVFRIWSNGGSNHSQIPQLIATIIDGKIIDGKLAA